MAKSFTLQQQKGGQYFITVPRNIVRMKDWKKGQELLWREDGKGNLVLKGN